MLKLIAKLLARPAVTDWLIRRAQRTPYTHIDGYMERWWLLNPYDSKTHRARHAWFPWSIRIHHILREDFDRHLHDHPWDARTFILRGWYVEQREDGRAYLRKRGDTARLNFGEFHAIASVPVDGVWTLFITSRFRGTWGFKVDGKKVPYQEYLAEK